VKVVAYITYGGGSYYFLIPIALLLLLRFARPGRYRRRGGWGPSGGGSTWPGNGGTAPPPDAPHLTAASPGAAANPSSAPGVAAPGWMPDPSGKFQERYWSGLAWTGQVRTGGVVSDDPVPPAPGGDGDPSGPGWASAGS
jgi:hypothetical protein